MLPSKILPTTLLAAAMLLVGVSAAPAAPVVVLSEDGSTRVRHDSFTAGATALDAVRSRRGPRAVAAARSRARRSGPTVRGELRRMLRRNEIDRTQYGARLATYNDARAFASRLSGRRRLEMAGVVGLVDTLTARRELTASRLAPLWLTLERNRQWWSEGTLLASGQRVSFAGSQLVWQYVAGHGLQLHPLANFGRLNGLWQGGRRYEARMSQLMDELLAVRVQRGGGVAWEYYFPFGPAQLPWVSGMAQATALQSLARAAVALERQAEVFPIAQAGLSMFEQAPPVGVRVPSERGAHYLLYSGDPELRVLNGFMQALSGLFDFAEHTGDTRARALYTEGRTAAGFEVPAADTGAWSLYSRGRVAEESSLAYHQLVTGFFATLCARTGDSLYCDSHQRFSGYLTEPPELRVLTRRLRAGRSARLRFRLSKKSAVHVTLAEGDRTRLARSLGTLGRGRGSISLAPPRRRGGSTYTVTLAAVDLAGNRGAVSAPVEVLPARRARRNRD